MVYLKRKVHKFIKGGKAEMRVSRSFLCIAVVLAVVSLSVLSHKAYSADANTAAGTGDVKNDTKDVKQDSAEIQALKAKVAEDHKMLAADREAVKAAKQSGDKTKIAEARAKVKDDLKTLKADKAALKKLTGDKGKDIKERHNDKQGS